MDTKLGALQKQQTLCSRAMFELHSGTHSAAKGRGLTSPMNLRRFTSSTAGMGDLEVGWRFGDGGGEGWGWVGDDWGRLGAGPPTQLARGT